MRTSSDWRPRLIALDIDGTIARHDGTVTERVRDAIDRARAAGAHVVLATGRTVVAAEPMVDSLGLDGMTAVCSNGAVLLSPTRKPLLRTDFDPTPVVEMLADRLPDVIFAAERLGVGNLVTEPFADGELAGDSRRVDIAELINARTPRLVAKCPARTKAMMADALADVVLPGVDGSYDRGGAWLTMVAPGTSKAAALEELRHDLEVSTVDTLAIGDSANDIEMLRWAAHGVAMGQAELEIKSIADSACPPVDSDGVAVALARYF